MPEILINVRPGQTRFAYLDERVITDFKVERKTLPTFVGSIYKGKVLRVLPGMQAAFVDIGLDKAAFLYVGDIVTQGLKVDADISDENDDEEVVLKRFDNQGMGNISLPPIQTLISSGDELMVQVAKDPLGTKGARITTHITLPGRNLVYMPTVNHIGVSRKIEKEEERRRLEELVLSLKPSGGVIIRTAGEGAPEESLNSDLVYLSKIWKDVQKNFSNKKNIGQVHSEISMELVSLRDLLNEDVKRVLVDHQPTYKKVVHFVGQFMPKLKSKVQLYEESKPLFDLYDIDIEISRSLGRKVWLKSGGYIVIDEAEALVVIDVNTGRFVGKKDLEETIFKTNLEASREIANQLMIRNCGGIIIIDFIDMEKETHKEQILQALQKEMAKDKAKNSIVSMSDLGLVEMTRKRTRPSLRNTLCEPCPYCEGKGYVKQKMTVAQEILREIERELSLKKAVSSNSVKVRCHSDVADWLYTEETEVIDKFEKDRSMSVAVKVEPNFHIEQYEINWI